MLDRKFIREHADDVQKVADSKKIDLSVKELLEVDDRRVELLTRLEALRKTRNEQSERIAAMLRGGADERTVELTKAEVRMALAELSDLEAAHAEVDRRYKQLMLIVPNVVSPCTPMGESDADNVEIKRVGAIREFAFDSEDHVTIGERLGLFDIARGVKTAGARNYFLTGTGHRLHRAVQQLAIDLLEERGFTVMDVPIMAHEETLQNTGFFPLGADQTFALQGENRWLVGTSEVPLVSYYAGEIIDVTGPIRLAGVSTCMRSEIGSAGRDVRGLYRVHQFAKVEQVVLCANDSAVAEQIMEEITANAERLLELLELPYRVVAVCTGDMSQKNYKQFDIETWMPSRSAYCETHSSSYVTDFQARRSNIRYRDSDGRLTYCHTLNNTAVASPRILIPLLENHQQEDGTVYIPEALRKYMHGEAAIR